MWSAVSSDSLSHTYYICTLPVRTLHRSFCRITWQRHLTCKVKETFEDTLVCVGLRRIVTVAFFAPCTNILTYLLTYLNTAAYVVAVPFTTEFIWSPAKVAVGRCWTGKRTTRKNAVQPHFPWSCTWLKTSRNTLGFCSVLHTNGVLTDSVSSVEVLFAPFDANLFPNLCSKHGRPVTPLVNDNMIQTESFCMKCYVSEKEFWILTRVRFSVKITSWWHYFFSIMWMIVCYRLHNAHSTLASCTLLRSSLMFLLLLLYLVYDFYNKYNIAKKNIVKVIGRRARFQPEQIHFFAAEAYISTVRRRESLNCFNVIHGWTIRTEA